MQSRPATPAIPLALGEASPNKLNKPGSVVKFRCSTTGTSAETPSVLGLWRLAENGEAEESHPRFVRTFSALMVGTRFRVRRPPACVTYGQLSVLRNKQFA